MSRSIRSMLAILVVVAMLPMPVAAQTAQQNLQSTKKGKAAPAKQTPPQAAAKPSLDGIDAFVEEQMKQWKVPGLGLAVVQDGKVILSKGYGFRDVEKKLAVTPKTLFAIGSITKSFTVTSLGMLVDDGKLDWDKPVREYLPRFRLNDTVAGERMTPRDLVTHRSGLPRHDALWYNSPLSRGEIFERLRYLEPSKDFRQLYQYNNLMFMTAGILAQEVSGMKWEDLMRKRVFGPLGMASTNMSVNDSQKSDDFAQPYEEAKDEIKKVPFRNIDQVGPAGSINSNIEDMTRYLMMHMNQGKVEGKQFLSEGNAAQMQSPQMVIPGALTYKEVGHASYGMAFLIGAYRGHKMVQHGGAIDGFRAMLAFLPQDNIGLVVLTNSSASAFLNVMMYNVFDRLLGLDQVGWSQRFQEREKKQKESAEEAKKKGYTAGRPGTQPSHELKEYAGDYDHPGYGILQISMADNTLKLTYNNITSPLKHYHYDIFEVPEDPLDPFEGTKISFFTNIKGDIGSLSLPIEPAVKEVVFTRKGEKLNKQVLESLVGQYQLGPTTVTITMKGEETLTITTPGNPTFDLIPTRGLAFDVKGRPGFSIEFKKDASGAVNEAVFTVPGGTSVAKRI